LQKPQPVGKKILNKVILESHRTNSAEGHQPAIRARAARCGPRRRWARDGRLGWRPRSKPGRCGCRSV